MNKLVIFIVLLFVLVGVVYGCKKYEKQKECLAKGHEWYFSGTDWEQSSESPSVDMHLYIFECDDCGAEMSKLHVELTFGQVAGLSALNSSGKTRIFRLRKVFR